MGTQSLSQSVQNGRQYNKKKKSKSSSPSSSVSSKPTSRRRTTHNGTKRRFINLDEDKIDVLSQNKTIKKEKNIKNNSNANSNANSSSNSNSNSNSTSSQTQGLLQMALPQFPLNGVTTNQQQVLPLIPQIPQIPHNLFKTNSSISVQSTNSTFSQCLSIPEIASLSQSQSSINSFGTAPPRKRMKLNPNIESTLTLNTVNEEAEKIKCRLIPSSQG